ncbi:MAG: TatD family hydrolase [Candidatus Melainabacteria bacterium]|nr:TatD family hydrolase [Candidatus Melainabacteria bacterium]
MQLIDTHAHICFDSYDEDRQEMMARAYDSGVFKLLHPCCNLDEIPALLGYTKEYDGDGKIDLYTAMGLHPTEIEKWDENSAARIAEYLDQELAKPDHKVRAVGETGLDYYHCKDEESQARQRGIFREQIALAKKYQLPLIVHTRDAWQDTLQILKEEYPEDRNAHHGTIHCYTGNYEFASEVIEHGFYISWSGIVTYKKNDEFREIAAKIPLDRVLVETDCPFLAPQAQRGKRNEPSFVNYVAETLAECYKISKEELAGISTENATRLFKL